MSELANYQKRIDFAQISSNINDENRHLTKKKEFVNNHFLSTKKLIQQYYNNNKTKEQQLSLVQDIKRLAALIKCENELLSHDIKYLQSIETESQAKLLSNQELRNQYSNESTKRFIIQNCLKEKNSYEKKLKEDLHTLMKYSFFKEFKRDIYINKITSLPFNYECNKIYQKKQSKHQNKKETLLKSYHSSLIQAMKELKLNKYQKRVDEGYIWKTVNEKYMSEISINMNNFSTENFSNCSSDSNDLFSIDEFNSFDENTNKSYSDSNVTKQEFNNCNSRKLSDMTQITKLDQEKDCNNLCCKRTNKSNSIANHSSFKIAKAKNNESEYIILRDQINQLKESIMANQKKITVYQKYQKKIKEHLRYLQLKISFSDFGIAKFNCIKRNTFGFSSNSFLFNTMSVLNE